MAKRRAMCVIGAPFFMSLSFPAAPETLDVPGVHRSTSDDGRNPCANNQVIEVLLAQPLAMNIIFTRACSCTWKRERSGRWRPSAANPCLPLDAADNSYTDRAPPLMQSTLECQLLLWLL